MPNSYGRGRNCLTADLSMGLVQFDRDFRAAAGNLLVRQRVEDDTSTGSTRTRL